jgi:hypothetical protein
MVTKKFVFPLAAVITVLAIVLVACGAKSAPTAQASDNGTNGSGFSGTPGANQTRPLPLAEQLVIGTFKLEGTSNAVDAKTAASLIPLWQAYAQLTSSNTAAQAEVDAVIQQIQDTMTPQQVQAITAMKLTRQDMLTEMSSLGLTNGFARGANGTPGFNGTPRAGGFAGGGFPSGGGDGGFQGGGGFPGGGGANSGTTRPTANPTQQALRAQFANRIPSNLMNALITLLQKKSQS